MLEQVTKESYDSFFALKFKTVKDLHLLGLLRENLVRECTRG